MSEPVRHRRRREWSVEQLAYGYVAGLGSSVLVVVIAVLVGA